MSVLVADDDRITTRVLESQLRARGHTVHVAHSGAAAWQLLSSEQPPLVAVLDWSMPNLSGPELCRKLRARAGAPYTYLILLTGRDGTDDMASGLAAGADAYLKKPYDIATLLEQLARGLDTARERRAHVGLPGSA